MELYEILYFATLRCNFFCKHCGARRFYSSDEEIGSELLLQKINESRYSKASEIVVTGGEPFLKEDIGAFILGIVNDKNYPRHLSITTNGYFTEKIEAIVSKMEEPSRILFNISVDGLETIHNEIRGNKNAYRKTMQTIEMLVSHGFHVEVNTVMQKDNLNELEYLKDLFYSVGMGKYVKHTPIPMTVDTSKADHFAFNEDEVLKIYPYIRSHNDLRHILSKGAFRIQDCHGGYKNIVVDPIGRVFPCARSAGYMDEGDCRNRYCMGDLRKQSIDEVLQGSHKKEVYENTVKKCPGCNANHDVNREKFFYHLKHQMNFEQIKFLLQRETDIHEIYDFNWDGVEYDNGMKFRWMNSETANIYVKYRKGSRLKLLYGLNLPELESDPLMLEIKVNEKRKSQICQNGKHEIELAFDPDDIEDEVLKVTLHVSRTWVPDQVFHNGDKRELGVALYKIGID